MSVKPLTIILASAVLATVAVAVSYKPAWYRIDGNAIRFYRDKGFEFVVDDSMAHHHETPTVEISIKIPSASLTFS
jgi:hypothetical protein